MNKYTIYPGGVRDNKDQLTIGSSDIPVLMKDKQSCIKRTPLRMWLDKTGQKADEFTGNYSTWLGHKMEPVIVAQHIIQRGIDDDEIEKGLAEADLYYRDFVKRSVSRSKISRAPTNYIPYTEARHPEYPYLVAHADALVAIPGERPYLVEAKHGVSWARLRSPNNPTGFDKNIEGPDGVPYDVQIQTQWQMLGYDIDLTCVCMIIDGSYMEWWIEEDKKVQAILLERADRFITQCEKMIQPDPQDYEDVLYLYPEVNDKALVLPAGATLATARELHDEDIKLMDKAAAIKKRRADIKNAKALMLKDNKIVKDGETNKVLFSQSISEKTGQRTQRTRK